MSTIETPKILAVIQDEQIKTVLDETFKVHFPDQFSFYHHLEEALSYVHEHHDHLRNRMTLLLEKTSDVNLTAIVEELAQDPLTTPIVVITKTDEPLDSRLLTQDIFMPPLRLGSLIDRLDKHLHEQAALSNHPIAIGPYTLHPALCTLTQGDDGTLVHLTEKERDILLKLTQHPGQVIKRQELLDDVWGYADGVETHTLETHIYRLRQKIETDPTEPQWLLTEEDGYYISETSYTLLPR